MAKKDKDYYVLFKGIKLNTKDANVVGLSLIFGMLGASLAAFLQVTKPIAFIVIIPFVLFGYFFGRKKFTK